MVCRRSELCLITANFPSLGNMFKRLKTALVTSYVGAIALGWLFSEGILHFVGIFSAPIAGWVTRRELRGILDRTNTMRGFPFQNALPELVKCISILLLGYFLLRWLYFTPIDQAISPDA